jgi:hypothetical protein
MWNVNSFYARAMRAQLNSKYINNKFTVKFKQSLVSCEVKYLFSLSLFNIFCNARANAIDRIDVE